MSCGCAGWTYGVAVGYDKFRAEVNVTPPDGKSPVRAEPESWVETTAEKIARIKARDDASRATNTETP